MQSKPLKILVIEDTPLDFLRLNQHLQTYSQQVDCQRVSNDKELELALGEQWDAILTDYHLLGMDFLATLNKIQTLKPETPILLVSGSIGEEMAVELLRKGISDFVSKGNFTRLWSSLQRALDDADVRRAKQVAEAALRESQQANAEAQRQANLAMLNVMEDACAARASAEAANNALIESERRYRLMFDANPQPMLLHDMETLQIMAVNEAIVRHYGYSREEFLAMTIKDIRPPEDLLRILENIAQVTEGLNPTSLWRHLRKDGSIILVEITSYVMNVDGRRAKLVLSNDVTERQRIEQELHESEERFRVATENMRDAFILIDGVTSHIVLWNAAAIALFGYEKAEAIGLPLHDLITPERYRAAAAVGISQFAHTGKGLLVDQTLELPAIRKGGEEFMVELSFSALQINGKWHGAGVIRDITQRKAAEATLKKSKEFLASVLEHVPVRIFWKDTESRYLGCNHQFAEDAGFSTADQLIGKTDYDLAWRDQAEQYRSADKAVMLTQTPKLGFEEPQQTPYGNIIWLSTSKVPLYDENNQVMGILGIYSDITERKQAENQLRKLAQAVEQSPESIVITNLAGEIEYINEAFVQNSGYSKEELTGKNPRILQSAATPRSNYDSLWQTLLRGELWEGEFYNRRKDGTEYIEFATISPLRQEDGSISHYVGVKEDITEKKRLLEELENHRHHLEGLVASRTAELDEVIEQLKASKERFAFALDATNDGIWDWDIQTNNSYCSPSYLKMLGYESDDLGADAMSLWSDLLHPEDHDWVLAEVSRLLFEEGGYEIEFRMLTKHEGYKWILSRGKLVMRAEDGTPLRAVGTHTDLTTRKALEIELRKAKDLAEAANRAKSVFLANMSHEIRTPMNAIIGMTYLLRQQAPSPEQAERLDKIDNAAQHLLAIINDILDLSKIEAGRMALEQTDFALDALLHAIYALISEQAKRKNLQVDIDVGDVPIWLNGDSTRLCQALLNFASNAVKFTEQGRIVLRAKLLQESEQGLHVRFEVQDTGIGIAKENIANLFAPFTQADNTITRKYGGTGLGLAITQHLARLMGGLAGVDSVVGEGSTFWITVWLQCGQSNRMVNETAIQGDAEQLLRQDYSHASVLLVEDNAINREVAMEVLGYLGLTIDTAENGQVAVEKVFKNAYDLVLMDVQMPIMDGITATKTIRVMPGCYDLPILAMTANAFEEDRHSCLAAGMNDFVAKPVNPQALYKTLLYWLAKSGQKEAHDIELVELLSPLHVANIPECLQDMVGLNAKQGLAVVMGDTQKYVRLLRMFADNHRHDLTVLHNYLQAEKFAEAKRLSHELKGVAATIGAYRVAEWAEKLDDALLQQADLSEVMALVTQCADELVQLVNGIETLADTFSQVQAVEIPVDNEHRKAILSELITLLAEDNALASRVARENSAILKAVLTSCYDEFVNKINTYEYEAALKLLQGLV